MVSVNVNPPSQRSWGLDDRLLDPISPTFCGDTGVRHSALGMRATPPRSEVMFCPLYKFKNHQNNLLHQKCISTQPHASDETLWHAATLPSQASSRNSGPERLRIRSSAVNSREFRRCSFAPAAIKAAAHSSFPESKASIKGVAPFTWYTFALTAVTL